jgi:gliding motility-associated-like protein
MHSTRRGLLSFLLIIAASTIGSAQMAGKYFFFKGDTLDGFDVTACYKKALIYTEEKHLNEYEKFLYIKGQECYFVEKKYHLPGLTRKSIPVIPVVTSACNNLGFETGDFTGWTGAKGYNFNSNAALTVTAAGIFTHGIDYPEPYCAYHTIVDAAAGNDPYGLFPMLDPGGGTYALRLGGEWVNLEGPNPPPPADSCVSGIKIGAQYYAGGEMIQQTFVVTKANAMFSYNYAVLLDKAVHANGECPYFRAEVFDSVGNPIPCLQYYVQSDSTNTPAGMTISATKNGFGGQVFTLPWTNNSLNLLPYLSKKLTVRFSAAGCTHGGHRGYAYVDATCGPVQLIASSPEVCLGGTIDLTAPGAGAAGTYSWSTVPPGGPGIVGSNTGQTVTLNASGTYEVKVTQPNGCFYTIDTLIAFYPNPFVQVTSTNATCSPGNDGTATATVTGVPPGYAILWTPAVTGQGTLNATGMSGGSYTCLITTQNGCKDDTTITIVQPPGAPVITLSMTPASCLPGADGTATAVVTGGNPPVTFTWSGPGPGPGFTGAGQNSLNATGLNGGVYTFTATPTGGGCSATSTITVTQPNAPTATQITTNVSCFGLSDGTDTVKAIGGSPPLTFSWTGGPAIVTGDASGLAAGTYVCTITDSKGCSIKETAIITQPALLTVTATGLPATCAGKCNGQVICVPSGGTTIYNYSWSAPSTCTSASCNNVCAGNYTANITDAHGCKATATTTVTEPTPLVIAMFPKPSHCSKPDGSDSATVSGGTAGYSFVWKPGAGSVKPGYHNIPSGIYTVVVKDNNGCLDSSTNTVPNLPGVNITQVSFTNVSCFGGKDGSAKDSASGGFKPYTYSWTNGGGTAAVAGNLAAGVYVCTVTDSAGCTNSVPVTISQPPPLTLSAGPPVTICIGQCTDLSAIASGGTQAYTYVWTQGATVLASTHVCPLVTTTYTVTCTDAHGCSVAPIQVIITVNPPLEVLTAGAATICPGASTTLTCTGSGGNGNYSYLWMPAAGLNNPNTQNPIATPSVTTTYTVIISDNCGTPTDSATVTVTLWPLPLVTFTSVDTIQCAPMCVNFAGASNPACASAIWTFGDGGTDNTCSNARHCYSVAGLYNVTYAVTDIHGCKGSKTIPDFINVLPNPIAAFTASPQPTTIIAPTISFTDNSINAVSWLWNFGNPADSTSVLQNPKFTYLDTGCFTVQLIVTAANGCTDLTKSPICIQPEFTFYAPNTFTPNGDGKNDSWSPKGIGIDPNNYDMMIFDRWGNLIYETRVWGQGWDGKANSGSSIAQIDTYIWKVNLKDVFGYKHSYIGHCNIVK